jgi:hypothetical protein
MFADIRGLRELQIGAPRVLQALIFHDDAYVACMSAPGADPDTAVACKVAFCGGNAWSNHERYPCSALRCTSFFSHAVRLHAPRARPLLARSRAL